MFTDVRECATYIKLLKEHMGDEAYQQASTNLEKQGMASARERAWAILDLATTPTK